jgi:protease I
MVLPDNTAKQIKEVQVLQGKRSAILADEEFEDSELIEPLRAMKNVGARAVIVGSGSKPSDKGKWGDATVTVDTTADKVKADDFDAIIVPGGYAADKMRLHQPVIDLVRKAHDLGKVVAVDLENAGANWEDEPVVRDGNLITSRRPVDLPPFNKAIIEALTAEQACLLSKSEQLETVYLWLL